MKQRTTIDTEINKDKRNESWKAFLRLTLAAVLKSICPHFGTNGSKLFLLSLLLCGFSGQLFFNERDDWVIFLFICVLNIGRGWFRDGVERLSRITPPVRFDDLLCSFDFFATSWRTPWAVSVLSTFGSGFRINPSLIGPFWTSYLLRTT